MSAINIENLRYKWSDRRAFGLSIAKFTVDQGEKALLLGASGSGKSTMLSLICGFAAPDSGHVSIEDVEISRLRPAARDRFRAEMMGVIFQQFNLLPYATVRDNIRLPLEFAPKRRARIQDVKREILRLCEFLELPRDIAEMPASELSVGQQQRVAAARALIGVPPIIIADEPTSALDASAQSSFLDLLFEQANASGTTVLMVSHDERLGDKFDRAIRLEDIIERDTVPQ